MSAEILRRAAALIRERAEAATEGPWTRGDIDRFAEGPFTVDFADVEPNVCGGIDPADAEHIASWHPAVALAVASSLDAAADEVERLLVEKKWPKSKVEFAARHPLAVARAFLGES